MCVDNPREGFADLFDTHPPIDKRVEALVKFAGGHDPGPLALPEPHDETQADSEEGDEQPRIEQNTAAPAGTPMRTLGRHGAAGRRQAVSAARPPINLGGGASSNAGDPGSDSGTPGGPWGPHRRN